jgi:hypothetical protein
MNRRRPNSRRSNAQQTADMLMAEIEILLERLAEDTGLYIDWSPEEGSSYHWHEPDEDGNCTQPVVGGFESPLTALWAALVDRLDTEREIGLSLAGDVGALIDGIQQAFGIDVQPVLDDPEWEDLDEREQVDRIAASLRRGPQVKTTPSA